MLQPSEPVLPWYKQFWPWFLIFIPLAVVIAGVVTFIIAQDNKPALVSGDYYKEGLAINANMKLEQQAKDLGISTDLIVNGTTLTIHLNGLKSQPLNLHVDLRHATISQHDRSITLTKITSNVYQSPFILPKTGKWYITIKDPSNTWEIKQVSNLPTNK